LSDTVLLDVDKTGYKLFAKTLKNTPLSFFFKLFNEILRDALALREYGMQLVLFVQLVQ